MTDQRNTNPKASPLYAARQEPELIKILARLRGELEFAARPVMVGGSDIALVWRERIARDIAAVEEELAALASVGDPKAAT